MGKKLRVLICIILSIGIGIVSSYILNTYVVPALDGDTLEMLAQIFYSQDVKKLGLEETIQQKYTNVSNILGVVLVVIFGLSDLQQNTELEEGVMAGVAWCGVHTCWHALKLYIWGIKLGKSVGDVDSFKLALDIINFHPIRLVLIYVLYAIVIAGILESVSSLLWPLDNNSNNGSSNKEQSTNDSAEIKKVSLEKNNNSSSDKEQSINSNNETKKVSLEKNDNSLHR